MYSIYQYKPDDQKKYSANLYYHGSGPGRIHMVLPDPN